MAMQTLRTNTINWSTLSPSEADLIADAIIDSLARRYGLDVTLGELLQARAFQQAVQSDHPQS